MNSIWRSAREFVGIGLMIAGAAFALLTIINVPTGGQIPAISIGIVFTCLVVGFWILKPSKPRFPSQARRVRR